jgi:hypothetical protein
VRKRMHASAAIVVIVLTACSSPEPEGATGQAARDQLADPIIADDGTGLGSCAFEFSVEALADRGFAFDGTVTEIREPAAMDAPYEVDFAVARWYSGGEGAHATLTTYDVSGTSLAGDLGLEEGDRILASGDDAILWGCGFSMPYSERDAALFEQAFPA